MTNRAIVIGGGVSGLAVAFELAQCAGRPPGGFEVLCLEATGRPGGCIDSQRTDGFLCEWAANGFLDNAPATLDLVRRLSLDDRVVRSREEAAKRFLFRGGRLRRLPAGPFSFLASDLLSVRGRARVLTEPLRRPRRDGASDESVFSFAARRIGAEAAEVLVGSMVSGIFAADVHRLSIRAAFPRLWELERDHGSLVRGMLARRRAAAGGRTAGGPAGPGGRLTSFVDGMRELTDALAARLGESLRLGAAASRVSSMGNRGFRVHLTEGPPLDAGAVVLACPAAVSARLLAESDGALAAMLGEIRTASLAVVHLGFPEAAIGGRPDGFGYLVPRSEGIRSLGTLWSSSIFPSRASEGQALLTTMIGGACDPDVLDLDDDALVRAVRADLARTMRITAEPGFVRVVRQPRGIPQYAVGHPDLLAELDAALGPHPGLYLAGNSYRGVSVNLCVEEAARIAASVADYLRTRTPA